jgi:hypothetical protein
MFAFNGKSGHRATDSVKTCPRRLAVAGDAVAVVISSGGDDGRNGKSKAHQRPKAPSTNEYTRRTNALLGSRRSDGARSQRSIV